MLNDEQRIASASRLADASEDELYAALGAATMAMGSADEVLALGAARNPERVMKLKASGFAEAADLAESPSRVERGRESFSEFLSEYGEKLKGQVCAHYKEYRDGKLAKSNLVDATVAAIVPLVVGTAWAAVVGILAVLVIKAALDMLCDVEAAASTPAAAASRG